MNGSPMERPQKTEPSAATWQVEASSPSSGVTPNVLDVVDTTGRLAEADLEWIRSRASAALETLSVSGELRIRIVDDGEMTRLHTEFLDIPETTDVLTFDLGSHLVDGRPMLDVDIEACIDEAERQAAQRGHDPRRELLLYIVHGVLHCLGFDDHEEDGARAMHAEEDRILNVIGVGTTFHIPGDSP